ncbi:hypothetical protein R3P38DRAFT_3358094, partial [Favolaschia claudopus]
MTLSLTREALKSSRPGITAFTFERITSEITKHRDVSIKRDDGTAMFVGCGTFGKLKGLPFHIILAGEGGESGGCGAERRGKIVKTTPTFRTCSLTALSFPPPSLYRCLSPPLQRRAATNPVARDSRLGTETRTCKDTALAAIAAIKDEQRREDIAYGGTANHPPSPARSHRQTQTPQFSPEEEEEMDSDPEADNSSGSDAFQPPDDSNDSSDDEEDPDDSEVGEEAAAAIPCKNKKKSAAPTSRPCVRPKILPVLQKSAVMAGRKGERQRVRSYLTDSE